MSGIRKAGQRISDQDLMKLLFLDKYGVPVVDNQGNIGRRQVVFDADDIEMMDRGEVEYDYEGLQELIEEDQGRTGAIQHGSYPLSNYL